MVSRLAGRNFKNLLAGLEEMSRPHVLGGLVLILQATAMVLPNNRRREIKTTILC